MPHSDTKASIRNQIDSIINEKYLPDHYMDTIKKIKFRCINLGHKNKVENLSVYHVISNDNILNISDPYILQEKQNEIHLYFSAVVDKIDEQMLAIQCKYDKRVLSDTSHYKDMLVNKLVGYYTNAVSHNGNYPKALDLLHAVDYNHKVILNLEVEVSEHSLRLCSIYSAGIYIFNEEYTRILATLENSIFT